MNHTCALTKQADLKVRFVEYPDRVMWQAESGKHPDFDIHYCPYCGQHLDVAGAIPTAMTELEREALRQLVTGRTVLEVGSLFGYSTIAMAEVAEIVWAVDPHYGYPTDNPRPTHAQFLANLERYGVRDNVIPIFTLGQRVLPYLPDRGFFDVVFIDCTRDAMELLEMAKALSPQTIAVHDYGHPEWTGATEAVDKFLPGSGRFFRLVDTLAIMDRNWKDSLET